MSFPNVSDLITTTLEARSGKIQDNITNNNAILLQMSKKGRIKPVSGGRLIYEELSFATNGNGGWYSGYDTLPTAAQDVLSAAQYGWKQYAVAIVISGLEQLENADEEKIIDLLEGRIEVAEGTMANDMSVGLYSDGTGSGGKQIAGLDAAVPRTNTTGTYGGIDRSLWSFWQPQMTALGGAPTSTNVQAGMNTLFINCTRGTDKPDLIMAGGTAYSAYLTSLQTLQRVTNAEMADAGFTNLEYMGVPVVLDGGIGGAANTNDMYFLNTKYLKFRPHKDRNMVPLSPESRSAVNQDATIKLLGWAGNLTCSGQKFQGRLKGA